MIDTKFFRKKKEYLTLKEIVNLTKSTLHNSKDSDLSKKISSVSALVNATENDVAFLTNQRYFKDLAVSKASACFVTEQYAEKGRDGMLMLINKNPHFAYTQVLNELYEVPLFDVEAGIAPTAFVSKTAKVGKGVQICHGAYIGEEVVIGDGCKIGVNSVINHNCEIGEGTYIGDCVTISYAKIGKKAIIQAGVRIGQCGFGFAHNQGFNHKVPQLGLVIIGDSVEIGSNTCIDRGALENTVVGNNTKFDNLVQIAHGVHIGQGCFFAGCSGIAGSTKFGNFVQVGGNSAVNGHIEIGDGTQIAGHSGVVKGTKPMEIVGGYPAMPIRDWHKINIKLNKMIKK